MAGPEPPVGGQRFLDEYGIHWLVQSVTTGNHLDGFFIVRLAYGVTPQCEAGVWVLGRREFEALCRERMLVEQDEDPFFH
jgi:hypothetical protein